ncbi:MAG: peptidase domain-containing ABC transporter [Muribaculum sp.]|nr:peptidase domain-containing ABC transporter [Muribaculum sp.]
MIFSKFKWFRQHDAMQCGVACLQMICHSYGIDVSQDKLASNCAATNQGVSMLAISQTAETLGFRTICVKTDTEGLLSAPLPCIMHWNQNHFVVLYGIKKNGRQFLIADPAKGKIKLCRNEFESHWLADNADWLQRKGIALFLQPTERLIPIKVNTESKNKISFSFLFKYLDGYKKHFAQIAAGLLLGCLLQLILPFLTQSIVDIGIAHKDVKFIWLVLLGEFMIVAGSTVTDFIRRWMLLHISIRINISLVSDFFIKLLKLPMSFFDTKLLGDLIQRMGDHGRVQSFLTTSLLNVAFTFLSFIVFGTVLFIYDKLIFCIFIIGSIVYGAWTSIFLSRRKVLDYELFEKEAANQNKTYDFISSMQEIKLQRCEQRRRWEWEDARADLFSVQLKNLRLQQTQESGSIFINEIKNIVITVLAASAVINGDITLGAMLAIQYIVGQLNSPVAQLMGFIYTIQDVKISLERINEIHQTQEESYPEKINPVADVYGGITLSNVCFKYEKFALKNIIDNVSFVIPQGKTTAIVGASGSGKTTLIKLMLGYYNVDDGHIQISGHNISEYNLDRWREQCGVVMQDGVIFSESIARNIAVDDNDIDKHRMLEAAKIAKADTFIDTFPLKYNTKIGREGVGLSQGQKQRILIARAVYKNPKFLFLDEATNSLDAMNERGIVENLENFCKGRTVVVVAHRLSTVKNADNIIVLDKGAIVESGSHQMLIDKKGAYYNLIKNQLELGN